MKSRHVQAILATLLTAVGLVTTAHAAAPVGNAEASEAASMFRTPMPFHT